MFGFYRCENIFQVFYAEECFTKIFGIYPHITRNASINPTYTELQQSTSHINFITLLTDSDSDPILWGKKYNIKGIANWGFNFYITKLESNLTWNSIACPKIIPKKRKKQKEQSRELELGFCPSLTGYMKNK